MGLVTQFFIRPYKAALLQPAGGSFTVDGAGRVVSCTLPAAFQAEHVKTIGQHVLAAFRKAKEIKIPLTEFTVKYETFKLRAQHLPHGALVYLVPLEPKLETDLIRPEAALAA